MPESKIRKFPPTVPQQDLDVRISVTRETRLPSHPVRLVITTVAGRDAGYTSVRVVDTIIPSQEERDSSLDALINVITSGIILAITSGTPQAVDSDDV